MAKGEASASAESFPSPQKEEDGMEERERERLAEDTNSLELQEEAQRGQAKDQHYVGHGDSEDRGGELCSARDSMPKEATGEDTEEDSKEEDGKKNHKLLGADGAGLLVAASEIHAEEATEEGLAMLGDDISGKDLLATSNADKTAHDAALDITQFLEKKLADEPTSLE